MKILVVGGAGYVGQRLCPHLITRGHEVKAWDAMLLDNPQPSYPLVWDDLFNIKSEHLAGYDRVIFLAGLSNDPMADFSPSKNFIQNTAAPLHVAYMAKQAGVPRFIYASSASVYGQMPGLLNENAPVAPTYPYGISKLAGERAVLQLAADKFQVIALRKGTVCGYSPRMRFDLAINAMYKDAKTKGAISVFAGQVHRPILGMQDCVNVYTLATEKEGQGSHILNVCSKNYQMERVGVAVQNLTKCPLLQIGNELEKRDYQISAYNAVRILDWEPKQMLGGIVSELDDHCADWTKEQFEDDRWYNIRLFRRQK